MKNTEFRIFIIPVLFILVVSGIQISFAESEERTRLETELVNSSTNKDDGNARFEERPDRKVLKIEIEDQKANTTFRIKIDGLVIGSITTDASGFAEIEHDSRKGSNIPFVKNGSKIEIVNSGTILAGIFEGQVVGGIPLTSTPITTNSVIIPLGAKDKNVTEYFSPRIIQVSPSDTVTWTNLDDTAHTVTGSSFDSVLLSTSQTFSHKFSENGTFDYVCQLHSWMTGKVIVGSGGPVSPPPSAPISSTPTSTSVASQNKVSIPLGSADKKVSEFFVPKSLTINVNESVLWSNDDSTIHTITSGVGNKDGIFDSGFVGEGKSFSFTFSKDGTLDYFCQVHPWMIGQIIVGSGGTTSLPSASVLTTPSVSAAPSIPLANISSTSKVSIPMGAADKKITEYFVPKSITIKTLDSVMWINGDSAAHTVTSGSVDQGSDGIFDSGILLSGKSFSFKSTKTGIFDYFCMVHPWMTGQIVIGTENNLSKETLLSPLKQIRSGVAPMDVQCRSNFSLVIKPNENSSVCVRQETAENLFLRGWKIV